MGIKGIFSLTILDPSLGPKGLEASAIWGPSSAIRGLCWPTLGAEFKGEVGLSGGYVGAKLGILVAMLRLSWPVLGHVEAICWVMLCHVDGFASKKCSPPANSRFLVILVGF